ncbi:MAG: amidase, partial [Pseudomonadota bacterium]
MADLYTLSIQQASSRIASGELKPSELMEACIERIEAVDGNVRAWAHFDPDSALMHARLADTRPLDHPLFGIPFGVKDIIEAIGLPTTYGTPIHHGHHSIRDAACVALLKEAGAIVAGKAVTTELAHFHPGKTRNPHSGAHTPGGSSSGSAAAVAAGMVPFALGTQTTGSVLRPASYCGVFGFKPSFGDVNRSGVFECVSSFDTVGWFARTVDDVETVRQGLVRLRPKSLDVPETKSLRVGLFRGSEWEKADGTTCEAIEQAAATLAKAGAGVSDVPTPEWFPDMAELHRRVAGFEFARAITFERTEHAHLLSLKLVDGRCGDGLKLSYEDYATA